MPFFCGINKDSAKVAQITGFEKQKAPTDAPAKGGLRNIFLRSGRKFLLRMPTAPILTWRALSGTLPYLDAAVRSSGFVSCGGTSGDP
jgi:hypothetical protein